LFTKIRVSANSTTSTTARNLTLSVSGTRSGNDGTSFAVGDTIQLSIAVDNPEDFDNFLVQYREVKSGATISYSLKYRIDTNKFDVSMPIEQFKYASGTYKVSVIDAYAKNGNGDRIYNSDMYSDEKYVPKQDLRSGDFTVTGAVRDSTAPVFESISVDKTIAKANDTVTIKVFASDDLSGLGSCILKILKPDKSAKDINCKVVSENLLEGTYTVDTYNSNGDYKVSSLLIKDKAGNFVSKTNSELSPPYNYVVDLSGANFTVTGAAEDKQHPRIESVTVDKKNAVPGGNVTVSLNAKDDVSGIRDFLIRVRTPSGGITVLSSNQFTPGVYEGFFGPTQFSESGLYRIDNITIRDNAGNEGKYYNSIFYPQEVNKLDCSAADFNVSGGELDIQPPKIDSVSVDKKEARPGDVVTVTINVSDDISGVRFFNPYIVKYYRDSSNTYRQKELDIKWKEVSKGVYEGQYIVGQYEENGVCNIEEIGIGDNASNYTFYYSSKIYKDKINLMDFSSADFSITETTPDFEAPKLASVAIDNTNVVPGNIATITVRVSDDVAGVGSCLVQLRRPSGELENIYGNEISEGIFKIQYLINQYAENGTYKIASISLSDKAGNNSSFYNSKLYSDKNSLMDFSLSDFTVNGAAPDLEPPELISVSKDIDTITQKNVGTLTIEATDNLSGIEKITAFYKVNGILYKTVDLTYEGNNIYRAYVGTSLYQQSGGYILDKVYLVDRAGRSVEYCSSNTSSGVYKDLSMGNFYVLAAIKDIGKPVFNEITIDKKSGTIGDTLTFNINCVDTESGIQTSDSTKDFRGSYITFISQSGKMMSYPIKYENGKYICIFNVGKYTEDGLWKLYELCLKDQAGNIKRLANRKIRYSSYEDIDAILNFSNVEFNISGTNCDIKAPVLENISIDKTSINFNQFSTISLKAKDDLSGIRISANSNPLNEASSMLFLSPKGEVKAFALTEDNGSYYVSFHLDGSNKVGEWKPVALILVDNGGNTSNYVQSNLSDEDLKKLQAYVGSNGSMTRMDFSAYTINVLNSRADMQPPVLNKAVIDKTNVKGKAVVNITFDIQDNHDMNNNFCIGYIVYKNDGQYKIADIINQNGKFTAKVNFNGLGKNGLWKVEHIRLEDEAGNSIEYINSTQKTNDESTKSMDLNYLNITATGMQGNAEEGITINTVSVSSNNINILENSQVEISIDTSGNLYMENSSLYEYSVVFVGPSVGYQKIVPLAYENGKLTGKVDFSAKDPVGTWRINEIAISRNAYDSLLLINSSSPFKKVFISGKIKYMDLSACDINVTGPTKDSSKPVLKTVNLSESTVDISGNIRITINAEDESGIHSVKATYLTHAGQDVQYILTKGSEGFQANISPYSLGASVGQWQLKTVEIIDNSGNVSIIGNYKNNGLDLKTVDKLMDLSAGDFNVTDRILADVTGDNQVDILDLALAARSYNLDQNSPYWEARADVNKDKKVDIYDLVLICRRQ